MAADPLRKVRANRLPCRAMSHSPVFIGVTAALLHGLSIKSLRGDTPIHTSTRHFEKKLLPAWVDVDTSQGRPVRTQIPPTPLIFHKITLPKDSAKSIGHRVRITDLPTTTLQCAAWLPAGSAQAVADSAARKLIPQWRELDRRGREAFADRIPKLRAQMTNLANNYRKRLGAPQARRILANMDPRFESYAESLFHAAAQLAQVKRLIPQFQVQISPLKVISWTPLSRRFARRLKSTVCKSIRATILAKLSTPSRGKTAPKQATKTRMAYLPFYLRGRGRHARLRQIPVGAARHQLERCGTSSPLSLEKACI